MELFTKELTAVDDDMEIGAGTVEPVKEVRCKWNASRGYVHQVARATAASSSSSRHICRPRHEAWQTRRLDRRILIARSHGRACQDCREGTSEAAFKGHAMDAMESCNFTTEHTLVVMVDRISTARQKWQARRSAKPPFLLRLQG